jgi:tetraacyldisaccharide 4'-kinase
MDGNIRINKILLPFSWIYGGMVELRNKLFDWGILRSEKFPVPVISIGNLAVGGTGKTPHTEYLIRLLSKKYKVAVLSRGYKRKSKGYRLADSMASVREIGDEPFQMYRKFPEILVAVDNKRSQGIKNLLALPGNQCPEIILLDDAFQHRQVTPSLSILLTDSNRLFIHDALLPAGRLREPAKNSARADMLIYTKCSETFQPVDQDLAPAVYCTSYEYKGLLPVFPEVNSIKKESLERLKKESCSFLLVAGLANPRDLIRHLSDYTSDLHLLIYSDHHNFSPKDIVKITETFQAIKNNNKVIITSEKDAVRLMNNPFIPEEIKAYLYYLPIEVVFHSNQENLFIQKIEDHVKNFARDRIMA